MESINKIAVAMIDQAIMTADPVKASNCVLGFSRMNRVSLSDRKNRMPGSSPKAPMLREARTEAQRSFRTLQS